MVTLHHVCANKGGSADHAADGVHTSTNRRREKPSEEMVCEVFNQSGTGGGTNVLCFSNRGTMLHANMLFKHEVIRTDNVVLHHQHWMVSSSLCASLVSRVET